METSKAEANELVCRKSSTAAKGRFDGLIWNKGKSSHFRVVCEISAASTDGYWTVFFGGNR